MKKIIITLLTLYMLISGIVFYANPSKHLFVDKEDEGWSYIEYTKHLA
ncbi:hypothetical protein QE109_10970 [Fusibacter bizertensis]|uniref:Uncharacterized protein n=1 Tax=Fusibacter bizertensis TaxID=1488331 RepID=A0ABT6NE41_9FIRM|nr:hypothetical protein [Fusibacter bizertensis]MDH8678673.1 hypothetical protein [Fusibacter bizertensis]